MVGFLTLVFIFQRGDNLYEISVIFWKKNQEGLTSQT